MLKITKVGNGRTFSIVVTVNLSWHVFNQTLKRSCKALLVPTKILKMLLQGKKIKFYEATIKHT